MGGSEAGRLVRYDEARNLRCLVNPSPESGELSLPPGYRLLRAPGAVVSGATTVCLPAYGFAVADGPANTAPTDDDAPGGA